LDVAAILATLTQKGWLTYARVVKKTGKKETLKYLEKEIN